MLATACAKVAVRTRRCGSTHRAVRKTSESFSHYVCPEPVLANHRGLQIEYLNKILNRVRLRGISCAGALLFYDCLEWHERWGILCGALVLEPAECVQKTRPPSLFTKRTSRATGDHLPRQALDKTRKDKSLLKNGGVFRSQPQQLGHCAARPLLRRGRPRRVLGATGACSLHPDPYP